MTTDDLKLIAGLSPGQTFHTNEGMTLRLERVDQSGKPVMGICLGEKWGPISDFQILGHFLAIGECPSERAMSAEDLASRNFNAYMRDPWATV